MRTLSFLFFSNSYWEFSSGHFMWKKQKRVSSIMFMFWIALGRGGCVVIESLSRYASKVSPSRMKINCLNVFFTFFLCCCFVLNFFSHLPLQLVYLRLDTHSKTMQYFSVVPFFSVLFLPDYSIQLLLVQMQYVEMCRTSENFSFSSFLLLKGASLSAQIHRQHWLKCYETCVQLNNWDSE